MDESDRVDFRSGCEMKALEGLINVFDDYDRHEFDDCMALEVHAMKEHVFSILNEVQKLDEKLPAANEYLLLSGSCKDGTLDVEIDNPSHFARGTDFDLDYTLLVPVLKLHDRNQPVVLDMRHSTPCHSWLSLRLFDDNTVMKWESCCCIVEHQNDKNHYLSPPKVCKWFSESLTQVIQQMQTSHRKGDPVIKEVLPNGVMTTLILAYGGTRIMYDLVPVISFRGWPAVAMGWLSENHFWDGIIPEEDGREMLLFVKTRLSQCDLQPNGVKWQMSCHPISTIEGYHQYTYQPANIYKSVYRSL